MGQEVHGVAVLTLAAVIVGVVDNVALAVRVREDTKVLPQLFVSLRKQKPTRQLLLTPWAYDWLPVPIGMGGGCAMV